jgi:hypothetical protein
MEQITTNEATSTNKTSNKAKGKFKFGYTSKVVNLCAKPI